MDLALRVAHGYRYSQQRIGPEQLGAGQQDDERPGPDTFYHQTIMTRISF